VFAQGPGASAPIGKNKETKRLKNMKNIKLTVRLFGLFFLVLASALFSGCASSGLSKYNTPALSAPAGPPAGKALVCIHRPKKGSGSDLFAPVWVDTNFVANLGNGYSVGRVCEPGQHYFLALSAEVNSCVEAQLLADRTYDLWLDNNAGFIAPSFKLKPIHHIDKKRQLVKKWIRRNRWVEPAAPGTDYGNVKKENLGANIRAAWAPGAHAGIGLADALGKVSPEKIQKLIEEFTSGRRQTKLQHLAPEDYR
jgi:hypothetical protein